VGGAHGAGAHGGPEGGGAHGGGRTGREGPREVDSRPSDAVTLALAAGVPIRVDSTLLDPAWAAQHQEDASSYPVATADIAAETLERLRNPGGRP
jgi:bifunctional DNase/RNase